ncbi:MAG TPA: hypothetical protein VGD43_19980 [Micromonospora sp.]
MAEGAKSPSVKWYLAFALVVLVVLTATGVWNPFPDIWAWVNRDRPLSNPAPLWQERLGASIQDVTVAGDAVVVRHRTTVEARSVTTGVRLWEHKADWATVAGGERDAVVAVGRLLTKGYEVLDPTTGAVRRRDTSAVAVWTYRNALLDARCASARDCTLTAWEPRGSQPLWSAFLPGVSAGLFADNPRVLGTRRLTADRVDGQAGGPEPMPALLGLPVDGRAMIVDTATGRVVQDFEQDREDRVVVVGGRLLRIEARSADGTCYFTIVARDPANGQEVWRRTGINLRTADGAGCAQREDPQGGQNVLGGVAADGRETVLDGYDGGKLWTGLGGERLLAVDDRYALVRADGGAAVNGHELTVASRRWTRPTDREVAAALTRYAAVLVERDPDRITALDRRTGRELVALRSSAKVFAVGPRGIVIGDGRDLAYVPFGTGTPAPAAPAGGLPGGGAPDRGGAPGDAPTCGGPKNERCPAEDGGKDG